MKIAVYNFKGGVGKTSISLNLAMTLKYGIITNDIYSPLEKVLPKKRLLKLALKQKCPNIPKDYNIIFDLGGYPDDRAIDILKQSNFVIIPTTSSYLDLQNTISSLEEIKQYNNNIIVVANKATDEDLSVVLNVLRAMNYDYPIAKIKKSTVMENLFKDKTSVSSIVDEGGLKAYHYKAVRDQFVDLIKLLKIKKI